MTPQDAKWHELLTNNHIRVVVDSAGEFVDLLNNDVIEKVNEEVFLGVKREYDQKNDEEERKSYNNVTCTEEDEEPSQSTVSEHQMPSLQQLFQQEQHNQQHQQKHSPYHSKNSPQQIPLAQLNGKEVKRREAVWELFTSECVFLVDYLMVLKNVRAH